MSALGQKQTAYLPTGCPDAPIGCPYWRAHRYARVAKTPSNVRMACSFPHNISKARDCGPASVVGIASSLWFVGIMPMRVEGTFASISTATKTDRQFWLIQAARKQSIL